MKVLVTGGSGFLGKRLQKYQPSWHYLSSKQCDLSLNGEFTKVLEIVNPDMVLHLAAKVGGIKDNIENQATYYNINTAMNTNVLRESYEFGVKRLLACLSTCAFPDKIDNFPYNEEDFYRGPPTPTNFSYGMTKRHLHTGCIAYRQQYGVNYSTFCPSNLYGPEDHFGKESSHFVASMVYKLSKAKENEEIEFWGTGSPLRQQLYVDDLCEILPLLLEKHNTSLPLIVAPSENLSILQMIEILTKQIDKNVRLLFNQKMDGQFRKDGSNKRFLELSQGYDFTSFEEGILETYKWFNE